jgi:hypothetical protein
MSTTKKKSLKDAEFWFERRQFGCIQCVHTVNIIEKKRERERKYTTDGWIMIQRKKIESESRRNGCMKVLLFD